jgi:hypothetical protein
VICLRDRLIAQLCIIYVFVLISNASVEEVLASRMTELQRVCSIGWLASTVLLFLADL